MTSVMIIVGLLVVICMIAWLIVRSAKQDNDNDY